MEAIGQFFDAVSVGDLGRVQDLLPEIHSIEFRVQALIQAIFNDHVDILEFLLTAHIPVNHDCSFRCASGCPLHPAVAQDKERMVALLLEAGATPDWVVYTGVTPLYHVQSVTVASRLLDAATNINAGRIAAPLHSVAERGREDLLREFMSRPGVDVNVKTRVEGLTPLHCAAMNKSEGSAECVAALLAAGADSCILDKKNRTPLVVLSQHPPDFADGGAIARRNRITTLLITAGDCRWPCVPRTCPGLEAALLPVWKQAHQELGELFKHLEPVVQAWLREALRALHHGGLDESLRMKVIEMVLK